MLSRIDASATCEQSFGSVRVTNQVASFVRKLGGHERDARRGAAAAAARRARDAAPCGGRSRLSVLDRAGVGTAGRARRDPRRRARRDRPAAARRHLRPMGHRRRLHADAPRHRPDARSSSTTAIRAAPASPSAEPATPTAGCAPRSRRSASARARADAPRCVQSPKCGNGNEPLDKTGRGVAARRDPRRAMGLTVAARTRDNRPPASAVSPRRAPGRSVRPRTENGPSPQKEPNGRWWVWCWSWWRRGCPSSPSRPWPRAPDRVPATSSCSATRSPHREVREVPWILDRPRGRRSARLVRGHRMVARPSAGAPDGRGARRPARPTPSPAPSPRAPLGLRTAPPPERSGNDQPTRRDELAARRARRATHPAN